ncbi:MAG: glycosyltransferase, partial [Patescibacteria group bacterium]|nr:glycosyltransferase [Patescibacteria group bacterium]
WLQEFAKHFERVEVICLSKGKYDLPANVRVHSLGKERGAACRAAYAFRFLSLVWRLRNEYDAAFVHMNPEYLVLAGWFWKLLGKKTALWYTHKSVDLKLHIAVFWADTVFTASKESFRLKTSKLRVMGHGIDTDFFSPDPSIQREGWLLSVGRLMRAKRHDLAIREAARSNTALRIAGDGPERAHLEALAKELGADVTFLGACSPEKLRDMYRRAARLIHRSETGSLDKVVLEAAACGLQVDSTDSAIAQLPLSSEYVRAHHSLVPLISRLCEALV